jgi:FtsP/CotA-like multicopper oxidase with cupredoxin domain
MFRPRALALCLPLLLASSARDALPTIGYHDNDTAAGVLADGTLRVALEIRRGMWYPNGTDRPGTPMLAFATPGGELLLPGPMIRVPVGTALDVTVRNATDSALVVRGLSENPGDTLVVAPGATGRLQAATTRSGNRFYYASFVGLRPNQRRVEDAHLAGALMVDGPERRGLREEVLVITSSVHSVDSTGALNSDREINSVNGRPWPLTRRLRHVVGDTLRFRVLNASREVHPLHLHGAYFRVDARGTALRDTIYAPEARRLVVTEFMSPGSTMDLVWSPDRPGLWLMHCHLTFHVSANPGFGADSLTLEQAEHRLRHPHHDADPDQHVEQGMGGLMLAIEVPPPAGWRLPTVARRHLRFVIPGDSVAGAAVPSFAPSIEEAGQETPALRARGPGATLFLRQDEPTSIRVVNHAAEPTAIHWHGMELESLYDGVVGLGGTAGQRARAVGTDDSITVLMTPPRAGTFIYHTHLMEIRQLSGGLYGPMIVLPPGAEWDPVHDHVFIVGSSRGEGVRLNGERVLPPLELRAGSVHRLRLINITSGSPGIRYFLVRADSSTAEWTALAKDGMDLPASQRRTGPSSQHVSMGETYDFQFVAREPGEYRLEARAGTTNIVATQPIVVRAP